MAERGCTVQHELQVLRDNEWLVYRTLAPDEDPMVAAEQVLANGGVLGVRVARLEHYAAHDLLCLTQTHRIFPPDRSDPDPLQPAQRTGGDLCHTVEAFYTGQARDDARQLLSKLLDPLKLTVTEALFVGNVARQIDAVPMGLQAALQKLGIAQTRGSRESAPTRVRELTALATALVQRIEELDLTSPLPHLPAAEHFPQFAAALRSRAEDETALAYMLTRVLATALPRTGAWLPKLAFLAEAYSPTIDAVALGVLDHALADILAMPSALAALEGEKLPRLAQLRAVADLYAGQWSPNPQAPGKDLAAPINALLSDKAVQRSRWVLRQRLLREVALRVPPITQGDIIDEAEALAELRRHIRKIARPLARDEELRHVLEWRLERLLARDRVQEALATRTDPLDKLVAACRLLAAVTGQANKLVATSVLREVLPAAREPAKMPDAMPRLAQCLRLLHDESVSSDAKAEFAVALDTLLAAGMRQRIQAGRSRAPVDTLRLLVRLMPLPDGNAIKLLRELAQDLARQPGFMDLLAERAGPGADAKQATIDRVRGLLADAEPT